MSAGHGGQVLLSAAAAALVIDQLPDGATLEDLGEHQLKGLGRGERVFQLSYPGVPASFPPLVTPTRRAQPPSRAAVRVRRAGCGAEGDRRSPRGRVGAAAHADRARAASARLGWRCAPPPTQVDRFEDGVFFVDLAAARDSEAVLAAIAGAIGLGDTRSESLARRAGGPAAGRARAAGPRQLRAGDGGRADGGGAVARVPEAQAARDQPRGAAPARRASLRGPAALAAERRPRTASAEQLAEYEAIQLFVERAQAVRPDFRAHGRQRRGRRRDLPAAGRPAAGARARHRADQPLLAGGPARPARQQPPAAAQRRRATCPSASRRSGRRSSGATSCSSRASNGCSSCSRPSPAPRSTRSKPSPATSTAAADADRHARRPRLARGQEPAFGRPAERRLPAS